MAMVSVDGERLQIRSEPSEPKQDSHWRESKVAVLETYQTFFFRHGAHHRAVARAIAPPLAPLAVLNPGPRLAGTLDGQDREEML